MSPDASKSCPAGPLEVLASLDALSGLLARVKDACVVPPPPEAHMWRGKLRHNASARPMRARVALARQGFEVRGTPCGAVEGEAREGEWRAVVRFDPAYPAFIEARVWRGDVATYTHAAAADLPHAAYTVYAHRPPTLVCWHFSVDEHVATHAALGAPDIDPHVKPRFLLGLGFATVATVD